MNKGTKWGLITVLTIGVVSPLFWQGLPLFPNKSATPPPGHPGAHVEQLKSLAAKKTSGNEQVVAKDVAQTAALCVRDCRTMLTELSNELVHVESQAERARLLAQHIKQHPQFVGLHLVDDGRAPIQVGQALRPDLHQTANGVIKQDKFYVSNLYQTNIANKTKQVAMTLGVPVLGDSHVTGALTADVEMGHILDVIHTQDTELGTHSKLLGLDGQNHQLKEMLVGQNQAQAKNDVNTYQLTDKTAQSNVDGTTWRVHTTSVQDSGIKPHHTQVRDEVLVRFANDLTKEDVQTTTTAIGGQLVRHNSRHTYIFKSSKMPVEQMVAYFKQKGALLAEPHIRLRQNEFGNDAQVEEPNDTFYSSNQWNLTLISADQAWQDTTGNRNATVAVVDTGVDQKHPEFRGRLTSGVNILTGATNPQDDNGHGTHVAGIIGARTNNSEGVAAIDWGSKIMPVKAMGADGSGSVVDIADGITWAADHGANVINLSLGDYQDSTYLHQAIQYAYNKGVVVVAAMGNDGTNKPSYPAAYKEVIAVAAVDENSDTASFSNYGPHCSISAPGVSIPSTYVNNRYVILSGTSMASPHIAGVAGLIKSINPKLSPDDVRNIIQSTADDMGPPGKDDYYGYGQVNVYKAVEAARATLK